jgi:hypothetical protein
LSNPSILDRRFRLSINPLLINKNEGNDLALFRTGWENVTRTPAELAREIDRGVAFTCELAGDRNAANFVCSELLSIDMDGARTIEDAKADPFVQSHLTIFYTTLSHTPDHHRFRLVFALPRAITTPQEMRAAYRSLALRLGGDRSATDPARLFYGSRGSRPEIYDRGITTEVLDELIAHGAHADQRDGVLKGYTTTVSDQSIVADRIIRLPNGETSLFGQLEPKTTIFCPFHYDQHASAFVVESKTGTLGIHCSTCAQTFWPPKISTATDFSDFDQRVREAQNYFGLNADLGSFTKLLVPEGTSFHPGLAQSHIYLHNRDYVEFPNPLPEGVVFVKSPKGTGKTQELSRLFGSKVRTNFSLTFNGEINDKEPTEIEALGSNTVLLIGHRIALIRQTCERLGLDFYLDVDGNPTTRRLGISVDSLHRLTWSERTSSNKIVRKEKFFQTVIIDESEQVLRHFLSETIEPNERDKLFKIFRKLLEKAKRVVVLDADLDWLSFETISKMAQPRDETAFKRSAVILNERSNASLVQIFQSKDHLIGDLRTAIADGKRVFVTSNSMSLVEKLYEGLGSEFGEQLRRILITSKTVSADEVKSFISDASVRALEYDAIFTSPSLGTGIDITFPDKTKLIDVVYGLFEANITTHFDCDQQVWRVRHPGEVKVWLNPRRFSFETSHEVIRRDIQSNFLYKSTLSDYDDDFKAQFHTDDPFIDMAVLARSQELASKNNLKKNYIDLKRRSGHSIEFIERDDIASATGSDLEALGQIVAEAKYRDAIRSADILSEEEFLDIKQRIENNEDVSRAEALASQRSRLERFYRKPISDELFDLDERERFRDKILRFEHLARYANDISARDGQKSASEEYAFRLRFVRDDREAARILYDLLIASRIFKNGQFDTETTYHSISLESFMSMAHKNKAVIENILKIEIRPKLNAGVPQLGALLKLIGLEQSQAGTSKAKALAGGKKVYLYRVSSEQLKIVEAVVSHRKTISGWDFIRTHYGPATIN